jgi:hypothetical protein
MSNQSSRGKHLPLIVHSVRPKSNDTWNTGIAYQNSSNFLQSIWNTAVDAFPPNQSPIWHTAVDALAPNQNSAWTTAVDALPPNPNLAWTTAVDASPYLTNMHPEAT